MEAGRCRRNFPEAVPGTPCKRGLTIPGVNASHPQPGQGQGPVLRTVRHQLHLEGSEGCMPVSGQQRCQSGMNAVSTNAWTSRVDPSHLNHRRLNLRSCTWIGSAGALPDAKKRVCRTSSFRGSALPQTADRFLAVPTSPYQQRSLNAALGLFLDLGSKTALHRAETVSNSALSRLLNVYEWDTTQCWNILVDA